MQVHEVIDNATLQVVLDPVDDDLLANVEDFQIRQVVLVPVFVDRLVDLFVISNAAPEVDGSLLWILAFVVGAGCLDVSYICHDQFLVVALGLDVDDLDPGVGADLQYPLATFLGGIRGI